MNYFGKFIKDLRQIKGLSLKKLSAELDVNYSYISKIENGKKLPSEDLIIKMAKALGYDEEEMLVRAGRIPEDILSIIKENPVKAVNYLRKSFQHNES